MSDIVNFTLLGAGFYYILLHNVGAYFAQLSYLELVRFFQDLPLTGSRAVFSVVLIYPSTKATPF